VWKILHIFIKDCEKKDLVRASKGITPPSHRFPDRACPGGHFLQQLDYGAVFCPAGHPIEAMTGLAMNVFEELV
jgi:hypothetical protein